jgi:hypothetical protein
MIFSSSDFIWNRRSTLRAARLEVDGVRDAADGDVLVLPPSMATTWLE